MLNANQQKKILSLKKRFSIYSPFADADLFHEISNSLAKPFGDLHVDKVLGLESRGFILGSVVAFILKCGFVVARKGGKMYPEYSKNRVFSTETIDYSGKNKVIEIENNAKAIQKGDRVLIVDDWFETGGQGRAAIRLVEKAGGIVVGIGIMLDEMTDETRMFFQKYNLHSLIVMT